MNVVIVESAAKAKTINKYLGSGYKVIASFGHVRDLPAKDGAVEPDNDFTMHWQVDDDRSKKVMREITDAVRTADKLILATDPDREGEAISWHLLQILTERKVLKKGLRIERVAFNAVTRQAITDALKHPRQIDGPLVDAYLARRALDYLVGFNLSPVLWRKLPGAKSAGRVQSVALRLVCDREAEIEAFRSEEYWSIEADLATPAGDTVRARLQAIGGAAVKRLDVKTAAAATAIKTAVEGQTFTVAAVDKKAVRCNRKPRANWGSRPSRRCRSPSGSTKASTSAARRSALSPTCGPTASRSCRRRWPRFAATWRVRSPSAICRRSCASTNRRPRTPRRRTRRSARPMSDARRTRWRGTSPRIRRNCTT
jgi:DNA topoisomerase-1